MKNADRNSEPLDAILRRAMRERPGAATPECADPESLAAYCDRSLAAPDRERLEAHFADCARCQMQLAAIARAGGRASDARPALSGIAWFQRWWVAIPALAAVAAVVVVITMMRPGNEELQRRPLVAMAKHEAPLMGLAARAPAPPSPAAAPASPVAASASNELAMNEARPESAPRAQAMSAQSGAAANVGAQGFGGATVGAEVLVTISPPDRSVTWIVGRNGMVRRRDADGGTRIQRSGVNTDLIAGAAPSATVCWIVGRGGTIIRTTDGEHWARVTAPIADNLVAVAAGSANNAVVTTAGGQSFATTDGGSSWHPQ